MPSHILHTALCLLLLSSLLHGTSYPIATLISTSCPSSPSPSSLALSSASAAGLFAKSSKSSCRCAVAFASPASFGRSILPKWPLGVGEWCNKGAPNVKGESSSNSSAFASASENGLSSSWLSESLASESAFCWLWRARRAASWRRARDGGRLRGGGVGGGSVGGEGVMLRVGWLGRYYRRCCQHGCSWERLGRM